MDNFCSNIKSSCMPQLTLSIFTENSKISTVHFTSLSA
jgi:hypothetical protein